MYGIWCGNVTPHTSEKIIQMSIFDENVLWLIRKVINSAFFELLICDVFNFSCNIKNYKTIMCITQT